MDIGGPRQEVCWVVMKDACDKYCHGDEMRMVFDRNVPALQVYMYVHYKVSMKSCLCLVHTLLQRA